MKVPVPAFAVTVPLTGCVAPDPSTRSGVIAAFPCTVITSLDADPAVPKAGCFAEVAAPDGRGRAAADTGCVACQKVPETGTV